MNRRDAVLGPLAMGAGGLLTSELGQEQKDGKPYRIAMLPDFPGDFGPLFPVFLTVLRESGKIEGRDFSLFRTGDSLVQDFELYARRAVDLKPDLILAGSTANATIPQSLLLRADEAIQ